MPPVLLLTILLIPLSWVLIIRPQQLRQRAHRALVEAVKVGDRVEAFSGIHGTLTEVRDTTVRIEVAEGVVVTMARLAIAGLLEDLDEDVLEDQVLPADPAPAPSAEPINGDQR